MSLVDERIRITCVYLQMFIDVTEMTVMFSHHLEYCNRKFLLDPRLRLRNAREIQQKPTVKRGCLTTSPSTNYCGGLESGTNVKDRGTCHTMSDFPSLFLCHVHLILYSPIYKGSIYTFASVWALSTLSILYQLCQNITQCENGIRYRRIWHPKWFLLTYSLSLVIYTGACSMKLKEYCWHISVTQVTVSVTRSHLYLIQQFCKIEIQMNILQATFYCYYNFHKL